MMFLVIFASLAAAMAVVSQGNLRVADTNLKIGRSLAAAETGMNLMVRDLEQVVNGDPLDPTNFPGIKTTAGLIQDEALATGTAYSTGGNAYALWGGDPGQPTTADENTTILGAMIKSLRGATHYQATVEDPNPEPRIVALGNDPFYNRAIKQLYIPKIKFGTNSPTFEVRMTPHPLPEDLQPSSLLYDDPYYDRMPFGEPQTLGEEITKREMGLDFIVGNSDPDPEVDPVIGPLDARFIRVTVTAVDDAGDANGGSSVTRSISRDFRIDKTIPYAILSNSRVMLGRNVSIEGNVASRFTDVSKTNGNPVEVESDFEGLLPNLDVDLDAFYAAVGDTDVDSDGDNRLNLENSVEAAAVPGGSPADKDLDLDGYVTEFDYVLKNFDTDANRTILRSEFIAEVQGAGRDEKTAEQLFDLLDSSGDERREGYDDGELNADDLVSKISGEVSVLVDQSEWETGFSAWNADTGATFKSDLQGTVSSGFGGSALNLGDQRLAVYDITQTAFNTQVFANIARNFGDILDPPPAGDGRSRRLPRLRQPRHHRNRGARVPGARRQRTRRNPFRIGQPLRPLLPSGLSQHGVRGPVYPAGDQPTIRQLPVQGRDLHRDRRVQRRRGLQPGRHAGTRRHLRVADPQVAEPDRRRQRRLG